MMAESSLDLPNTQRDGGLTPTIQAICTCIYIIVIRMIRSYRVIEGTVTGSYLGGLESSQLPTQRVHVAK